MNRRSLTWQRPGLLAMWGLPPVWGRLAAWGLLAGLLAGCQAPRDYLPNNYVDEFAQRDPVSTTSVDLSRAHDGSPSSFHRDSNPISRPSVDGSVTHGPLYFEDPFEDSGSDDGRFAWTGEDALFFLGWNGRFLLNGAFLPVSAVVTPPWRVMVSDGHRSTQIPGKRHDATRWTKPRVAETSQVTQ